MEAMPRAVPAISTAAPALLWCALFWRAATQSLTHDEALTWQLYLTTPFSTIFQHYNPNNHLLATLLMRVSAAVFGFSEPALRLPSLAAAILYFVVVRRLALRWFGLTPPVVLAILLLSVHPLLLDFFVAARGYGLATACYLYGFAKLLEYAENSSPRSDLLHRAAAGLALAVAANLTFLFASFVTAVLFLVTCPVRSPSERKKSHKRRGNPPGASVSSRPVPRFAGRSFELRHFVAPVAVLALVYLLAVPLEQTTSRRLYKVETSLAGSLENLAWVSVAHNEGLGEANDLGTALRWWARAVAWGIAPFTVALALWIGRRGLVRDPANFAVLWPAGAAAGSVGLHVLTHYGFRWPYPADRTGLYLIVLFGLTLVALIAALRLRQDRWRQAAWPFVALAGVLVVHSLIQFNWSHFHVWRYNADDKRIVEQLEALHNQTGRRLSVGISWQLEPVYNYYRERRRADWLPEFDRSGPRGDFEYYVLIGNDQDLIAERGLEVLYRGPVSGTVLARRRDSGGT